MVSCLPNFGGARIYAFPHRVKMAPNTAVVREGLSGYLTCKGVPKWVLCLWRRSRKTLRSASERSAFSEKFGYKSSTSMDMGTKSEQDL